MEANRLPTPKAGRWYANLRAYAPGRANLKLDRDGNKRTACSLRHT
jgi:hypothetical protein